MSELNAVLTCYDGVSSIVVPLRVLRTHSTLIKVMTDDDDGEDECSDVLNIPVCNISVQEAEIFVRYCLGDKILPVRNMSEVERMVLVADYLGSDGLMRSMREQACLFLERMRSSEIRNFARGRDR